ncbi:hypothetical protein DdX_18049 [Ditylenchus destructor]|uniref:Uncharacterized protein n=1 Tax=Ditylenchus destructor TaxID=166010 RepID=A0AAD4MQS9_9BILA|nr:hypothetical protein DdX_18049 [Ditylenchus destructor]
MIIYGLSGENFLYIENIVPAYLCFGPFGRYLGSQTIVYKLSTACCFGFFLNRWISFVKNVRFRNQNLNFAPKEEPRCDIKLDSFICLLGITFYLSVCMWIHGPQMIPMLEPLFKTH